MNSIQIIGRLTKDPEVNTTKTGQALCRMRVAVPRPSSETEPVYIDVVAWERLAETCGEYLAQGRQVAISGRLDYSEWNDAEGARHSRHEIVASGVDFLAQPKTRDGEVG
jgi:single-strand DNA-binding protein